MTVREAYATLGLNPFATTPELARARFRELIRAHHPDGKPADEQAQANETTRRIIEACMVLRAQTSSGTHGSRTAARATAGSQRPGIADAGLDDLQAWAEQLWREYARREAASAVWPAASFALPALYLFSTLNLWMTGLGVMSRMYRKLD